MQLTITFLTFLITLTLVTAKTPNIIILYIDDLGWADTEVRMNNADPDSASDFHQTKNLARLATRGMKFSSAYAPAPTCTPSRKSIQFGKTPARLGYTFVHDVIALENNLEWKDETSLADVVKAANPNYITAHFGKGMGNERMETIGYDITDETDGNAANGNFHGDYISLKTREKLPADNPKRMPELQKRSVDFINENAGKNPFFMMISHYAVHVPHAARPDLIEKYRQLPRGKHLKDADYLPEEELTKNQKIASWRLQYAAMLEEVDEGLGAITDALEKSGELENTIIIFTSDNGGGLTPNGSLKGGKANLYEGGLRVPFVVAGPGIKANTQCDIPIAQWDLLPTLHDYTQSKAPLPEQLDGGSLRSVFENGNDGTVKRPNEAFIFHYPCFFAPPLKVIRLGDYKLMEHLVTGEQKLFNLSIDLAEKNNIIQQQPERAAAMQKVMNDYLDSIDAEDIHEVYKARFRELDKFESTARLVHARALEQANGDQTKITEANERLNKDLERFKKNREECHAQMKTTKF